MLPFRFQDCYALLEDDTLTLGNSRIERTFVWRHGDLLPLTLTDKDGNKTYGAFNPNRDYFRYNGYGNLVSADYKDYTGMLDKYAVESMSENRSYVDSIDDNEELSALFDELEAAAEEE